MKHLLAILKTPPPRYEYDPQYKGPSQIAPLYEAYSVIAWDEVNDVVVERLGWLNMNADIYARLTAREPDDTT